MEVYPQGSPRGGENENPNQIDPRLPTNGNGETITTAVCRCGKTCKNSHGLKIHQARMKCLESKHVSQRTDVTSDETQEELSQEAPHSAQSLRVPLTASPGLLLQAKVRIKWPQACKTAVWRQFDEDVDKVLEAIEKGDVDRRLQAMTTIISSLAQERFGVEEKRSTPTTYSMNHRAAKIRKIRQELKSLKKQYKEASEEQRPPLEELRAVLRKRLMTQRRAEWHRRRRKERSRKRASFIANPFGFTKCVTAMRWALQEQQGAGPSRMPPMQPRKPRDGSGSVEEHHGGKRVLPEHKSRSDQPWLGRLGEGV
ncbi:reverse transcriptase [Labeo rohita]|nr:reverse transcriptase [Labeo rohita]